MRLVGWLLLACVAVAALKLAIIALLVAFGISLIWRSIAHPKETLGLFVLCIAASLTKVNPLICLAVLTVGAAIIASTWE
jgi:hypothetical protein